MRACVEALCCDALVVTRLANVFYLAGFRGSAGAVVLKASRVHLATDGRYVAEVSAALETPWGSPGTTVVCVEGSYDETIADILETLGCQRIAIKVDDITLSRFCWLSRRLGLSEIDPAAGVARVSGGSGRMLVSVEGLVAAEQIIKDAGEIDTWRRRPNACPPS